MTPPLVVDHQVHWYSEDYLQTLLGRDGHPRTQRTDDGYLYLGAPGDAWELGPTYFDLGRLLASMDEHGIDISVVSANLLGEVSRLPAGEAEATLEALNAEVARAQSQHPERIVGLAMLPMQDADAALRVLERAVSVHDLKGVCILSNTAGAPIVTDAMLPVYRRIDDLGLPVFLHPAHVSVAQQGVLTPTIEVGLAWMFDTAAAALALVYGGVLDACPGLTVVHPHLGGALPAVVGRVVECEFEVHLEHDLGWYLRDRFYVDSVQKTPGALRLAIDTYGADRIVFGTDFPWVDPGGSRAYVEDNLAGEELELVLRRNRVPNLALPVRS